MTPNTQTQPISTPALLAMRGAAAELMAPQDIISLTNRLADVLRSENEYLKSMQIREIADLQEEKRMLITALETQNRMVKKNPKIAETIPSKDKEELAELSEIFNLVLQENYERLKKAKAVNERIVLAIKEVVSENARSRYYTEDGMRIISNYEPMSVTLDKTV